MTTKQLDKILEPHCPQGVLYNLRKVRGQPLWRLQVFNQAEWEARGVLTSYLEVQLGQFDRSVDQIEEFVWTCQKQLAYDWQKAAVPV
jgi:hypothetical protein